MSPRMGSTTAQVRRHGPKNAKNTPGFKEYHDRSHCVSSTPRLKEDTTTQRRLHKPLPHEHAAKFATKTMRTHGQLSHKREQKPLRRLQHKQHYTDTRTGSHKNEDRSRIVKHKHANNTQRRRRPIFFVSTRQFCLVAQSIVFQVLF